MRALQWISQNMIHALWCQSAGAVVFFVPGTFDRSSEFHDSMQELAATCFIREPRTPTANWDVLSVTQMSSMFGHSQFNGNISTWNVLSVRGMMSMFEHMIFNGNISTWDVLSVIYMRAMF